MTTMELNYAPPTLSPYRRWPSRRRVARALVLIVGSVMAYLVFASLSGVPATRLREEVDLTTGQVRRTEYVLFFRTRRQIQQTALSMSQARPSTGLTGPQWHLSRALADGRSVLPHWGFRSPVGQVRALEALWQVGNLTQEAKQEVAVTVLTLWQTEGGLKGADDYIRSIEDLVTRSPDGQSPRRLTPADLPSRRGTTRITVTP